MNSKMVINSTLIITAAILAGGCQLINPQPSKITATPTPTPKPTVATPLPTLEPTPIATPSATPKSNQSSGTKGGTSTSGTVKGTSTTSTTVTTRTNPLYDVSFNKLDDTNFPGQSQSHSLTLYNHTNQTILFAAKLPSTPADNFPVNINNGSDVTGKIDPQGSTSISITTLSSGSNTNFSTTLSINFVSGNQVVATQNVSIAVRTPTADTLSIDTNNSEVTFNVAYKPQLAYPIRINNTHGVDVNWTAQIFPTDVRNQIQLSAASGLIHSGSYWLTNVHFADLGGSSASAININFVFKDTNGNTFETKVVNIKFNR